MNFELFGKTMLVVNLKFDMFVFGPSTQPVRVCGSKIGTLNGVRDHMCPLFPFAERKILLISLAGF